jgi:hypothetical protein
MMASRFTFYALLNYKLRPGGDLLKCSESEKTTAASSSTGVCMHRHRAEVPSVKNA